MMNSCPLSSTLRFARTDFEILDFSASFNCGDQPARPLTPTGPCLRRLRIAVLRKHPRVFAAALTIGVVGLRGVLSLDEVHAAIKDCQALFELAFFRGDPDGQQLADLFMERP